ncbi:MAG TPA: prephenate dehydrogenase/arogenate dehydrogenase family protein [Thermoleophilaceae bacterium]|nr:prephenate dehydrogenase/arogenate dehydrogenase family protein [Thermoleophilaceae bacterium]
MRIAILGVGLIGGSIGLAARERLDGARVVGWDPAPDALDAALGRGALDETAPGPPEALDGADACFLCAPVAALPTLLLEVLDAAPEDCVVTDVGSTKRLVAASTEDPRFVGGHPVAGAEASGVSAARADLFEGAPWYLTPGPRSSGLLYERLHRLVAALGAGPVAVDPDAHDRLLATVSHLPHVLANVLVGQAARTLRREGEPLPRVGPSFRDATRVAGASSEVWTGIYATNAEAIAAEIDQAVERLREAARTLRSGSEEAIAAWNDAARQERRRLHEAEVAGGPVHELRVSVPNRPGTVARVALALGRAGVDIADMSLAPAADMRSGAMSLWVAGDEQAERATGIVEELGFPVVRP